MLSDCPRVPTEAFLKGMSARVISKLTETGTLWNSGDHKTLSKSIPVINSFINCELRGDRLISLGPACQLDTQHLLRTYNVPGTGLLGAEGGFAAIISFNLPRKCVKLVVLTPFYSQRG